MSSLNKPETVLYTHPVPENDHGVFAFHDSDNIPMAPESIKVFIDGPFERGREIVRMLIDEYNQSTK